MPWQRPEIAERRGSPITLGTPALLESRVRGPDADWNQLSAVAIEAIQVQESCVRKHGVIGLWPGITTYRNPMYGCQRMVP